MTTLSQNDAILHAVEYLALRGHEPPAPFGLGLSIKAAYNYTASLYNTIGRYARSMFDKRYDFGPVEFARDFAAAVEAFLIEAWQAGMTDNGLTADEMEPEWADSLAQIVAAERSHIPDLAAFVSETVDRAKSLDDAWPAIHARVDVWVNRYPDVRNQAKLATAAPRTCGQSIRPPRA